ncbi:MAG: hypothetical protein ACLQD9_00480 [Thermoplasmata archaeon]
MAVLGERGYCDGCGALFQFLEKDRRRWEGLPSPPPGLHLLLFCDTCREKLHLLVSGVKLAKGASGAPAEH